MKPIKHQPLFFITAVLMLLSACQPNPEQQIVKEKSDLRDIIEKAATDVPQNPADQSEWQEDYTDNGFTVHINAQLKIPEVTAYPIDELTLMTFQDSDVQKIIDFSMPGEPLYDGSVPKTKANIALEIVNLKRLKQKADELGTAVYGDHGGYAEELAYLEEEYRNAPETISSPPSKVKWENGTQETGGGKTLTLRDTDNQNFILGSMSSYSWYVAFANYTKQKGLLFNYAQVLTTQPEGIQLSYEEAQQRATEMALALRPGCILSHRYVAIDETMPTKQAYAFYFSNILNNIPFTLVDESYGNSGGLQVNQPVKTEQIGVILGDDGLVSLNWEAPYEVGERVADNVQLLGFKEIKGIFMTQMKRLGKGFLAESTGADSTYEIEVTEIKLGYMVMREKDTEAGLLGIPVWDFIGSSKITRGEDSEVHPFRENADYSILTINAINGAIVNRNIGY